MVAIDLRRSRLVMVGVCWCVVGGDWFWSVKAGLCVVGSTDAFAAVAVSHIRVSMAEDGACNTKCSRWEAKTLSTAQTGDRP